jgi:hypothetical protein
MTQVMAYLRKFMLVAALFSFLALPNSLNSSGVLSASAREPNCCEGGGECLPETACNFSTCECWCLTTIYPDCCELYPWVPNCNGAKKTNSMLCNKAGGPQFQGILGLSACPR